MNRLKALYKLAVLVPLFVGIYALAFVTGLMVLIADAVAYGLTREGGLLKSVDTGENLIKKHWDVLVNG